MENDFAVMPLLVVSPFLLWWRGRRLAGEPRQQVERVEREQAASQPAGGRPAAWPGRALDILQLPGRIPPPVC